MMSHLTNMLCPVLVLAACAGPAREVALSGTEAGARPEPLSRGDQGQVTMVVEVPRAGAEGTVPLPSLGAVRSGDRLAVQVTVDRPAYVYLVRTRGDGQRHIEYPTAGERRVGPGPPARLPEEGWIDLDQQTGLEHITLVAATEPLPGAAVLRMVAQPGPQKPEPKPKEPTQTPCRPNEKGPCDRGDRLQGRFGPEGTAVLSLPFYHR